MSDNDQHVQHTWQLTRDGAEDVTIELWADGETVRVDGGEEEATEGGRSMVERLLAKYTAAGYRIERDYPVNDPAPHDEPVEDDEAEPDGGPDKCPECGSPVEYDPRFGDDYREGAAWLCTGCKWGQWVTV
ncbi:hypothetical protein [Streptomyces sp. AS02]|uniref:hypothetical protein n=1 Tax=Streptomyces sp. AS02 TaxID=2938946 RepID=UPI0020211CA6|nr:hypothetical protein [Streptomyces sp. AS02]MCL8016951.1 hypothetical protein [Streptomyces sp. AS02]